MTHTKSPCQPNKSRECISLIELFHLIKWKVRDLALVDGRFPELTAGHLILSKNHSPTPLYYVAFDRTQAKSSNSSSTRAHFPIAQNAFDRHNCESIETVARARVQQLPRQFGGGHSTRVLSKSVCCAHKLNTSIQDQFFFLV